MRRAFTRKDEHELKRAIARITFTLARNRKLASRDWTDLASLVWRLMDALERQGIHFVEAGSEEDR